MKQASKVLSSTSTATDSQPTLGSASSQQAGTCSEVFEGNIKTTPQQTFGTVRKSYKTGVTDFDVGIAEKNRSTWAMAATRDKKTQSLEMVTEMMQRLNENRSDSASAHSKVLPRMQEELQKVSQAITGFLILSSEMIDDEGKQQYDDVLNQLKGLIKKLFYKKKVFYS